MTFNEIGKSENKDLENFRQAVFYSLSQLDIKSTNLWNMLERIEQALVTMEQMLQDDSDR